jgi:hypothetical protein
MTNLIAKVAELRKLEGRRQSILERQREMGTPNHSLRERLELEHEMRNAAPKLLDILGKIQAGDAEILEETIIFLNRNGHAHRDVIGMLYRLSDLARLMERPLNDIQCAESPRAASPGGGAMIPPEELADMRITADNLRKTDMNDASRYIDKLFTHVDEQASQIATLQAALIGRDLRLLESCNGECGKNNIQPEDCDQCEHDYVVSQLAREYPEIFAEEKK